MIKKLSQFARELSRALIFASTVRSYRAYIRRATSTRRLVMAGLRGASYVEIAFQGTLCCASMDLGRLAADYGKADDALEEIRTLFEHRLERLRKYGYIVEKTYEYPQFEAYHGYRISW